MSHFVEDAGDRLRRHNVLQVRGIGPGLLATPSIRGAGPARTPVVWQSLNLQSPMNGVYDLSLMPLWPGDQLEIRQGGQSAALSSGAMSGSVHIKPDTGGIQKGLHGHAGLGFGSFGARAGQAGLESGSANLRNRLRAAWAESENNFPFINTAQIGAPLQYQQNNQFRRLDVQHIGLWNPNPGMEMESAVWWQRAHRSIPPAMTEAPAESWQKDEALRASFSWRQYAQLNRQWQQQLAWMDERLVFHRAGDNDSSRSQTLLWRGEYTQLLPGAWTWRSGVQAQHVRARADGYADTTNWQTQGRLALSGALEKLYPRWKWTLLLRQEWAQGQGAPFSWSLASTWKLQTSWELRGQIARNFNLPTFNDRFWQGLGKPDLKPEQGYSAHLFLHWQQQQDAWGFQMETGLFHLLLDNWIIWQPGADGLFRPDNLRQVWSRGLEMNASAGMQTGSWFLNARLRYQFMSTTNTNVYGGSATALDKQLPYTPQHNGSVELTAGLRSVSLSYIHQWTGRRFTNSDNSLSLSGFNTGMLQASCRIGNNGRLGIRLDNCWNERYQIVAFRPMPGRNWQINYLHKF